MKLEDQKINLFLLLLFLLGTFQLQAQTRIIGTAKTITREAGKRFVIPSLRSGNNKQYRWFKDGKPLQVKTSSLVIPKLEQRHSGKYHCRIQTAGQSVIEQTAPFKLRVGNCTDATGAAYPCDEQLVKYTDNLPLQDKLAVRKSFGAVVIDSCHCRDFELWRLPDTLDVEGTGIAAREKPEINDTGANYGVKVNPVGEFYRPNRKPLKGKAPANKKDMIVALIDTGIDYWHPDLQDKIWINPNEKFNRIDDDGNCFIDDAQGFNFVKDNWWAMDFNGHGTHIAGIIASGTEPIKIMNLKAFDKDGSGSLFNPICAIYYAASKNVPVINLSWGYYGAPSSPLRNAIIHAGNKGAIVIVAAGNDSTSHAQDPHYPSGYTLPNMLSIAALNAAENDLAVFSNYGRLKIDLAAPGEGIESTSRGGGRIRMDGTSMSAGFVSRTAALLRLTKHGLSFRQIKECLLRTVDPVSDRLTSRGKLNEKEALREIQRLP